MKIHRYNLQLNSISFCTLPSTVHTRNTFKSYLEDDDEKKLIWSWLNQDKKYKRKNNKKIKPFTVNHELPITKCFASFLPVHVLAFITLSCVHFT